MPISKNSMQRAVQNVVNFGDTDIFPFPFENVVFRNMPDEVGSVLKNIDTKFDDYLEAYPPQFESTLTPVGYNGFRWATQICPFWNAYFLAMVAHHAPEIEGQRVKTSKEAVFSYRMNVAKGPDLFQSGYNWSAFMRSSYEAAQNYEYMIITDISEFYRRVYHHRTENALRHAIPVDYSKRIMKLLGVFSNNTSYGLPIGGPAARIISEVTINQVDHLLVGKGVVFKRFCDDYHVFVRSQAEAYDVLRGLSELLILNQGLSLQKSKTRILPSTEFIGTFPSHLKPKVEGDVDDRHRLFSLSLSYDPYSPNAESDYEALKSGLQSIDFMSLLNEELQKSQIHGPTIQRLLQALKALPPHTRSQAIRTIFESLDVLYPVFSQLMIVTHAILDDLSEDERQEISGRLIKLWSEGSYILRLEIHRAFALRVLARIPADENGRVFRSFYETGGSISKRDAILAFLGDENWHELSNLKNFTSNFSRWERRAFIYASYYLGDEGRYWREKQTFDEFDVVVRDYAAKVCQTDRYRKIL